MKRKQFILLKVLVLIMAISGSTASAAFTLVVNFKNVRNEKGSIKYLVFNGEEGYPDNLQKSFKSGTLPSRDAGRGVVFENFETGTYAITVIHDENDNDKLDTNFLGIPKEGFGFSNNPAVFFGPPSFNKTKVEVNKDTGIIIEMKYF